MIFYLFLIVLIIITTKHIYEIHNFNHMGTLEQLQSPNKEEIFQKLQNRNPLLIHNLGNRNNILKDISFDNLLIVSIKSCHSAWHFSKFSKRLFSRITTLLTSISLS